MGTGIFSGDVFVVPGLAVLLITSTLGVSLGQWIGFGLVIGLATALLTTFLYRQMLRAGLWRAERDEEDEDVVGAGESVVESGDNSAMGSAGTSTVTEARTEAPPRFSLGVRILPIIVPLVLIAGAALADLFEYENSLVAFFGDANIALFIGLLLALVLARLSHGTDPANDSIGRGFRTTGGILLITGVGGSLGEVIGATTLADTLGGLFSADGASSGLIAVLLAWFVAALMHLAIGSVSVAALAASGIIAPVLAQAGASPLEIGLAIASGALFAVHVNSNFFWMFKALHGLTTSGALKTLTLCTSIASLVSLPLVIVASFVV